MIQTLEIKNFKSLRQIPRSDDQTLEFDRVNVLVGPNGSGKSALLQAIDFLRAFFMSSVEVYLQELGWNFRDLPNLRERNKVIRWDIITDLSPDENGKAAGIYSYHVTLSPKRYLSIGTEYLGYSAEGTNTYEVLLKRKGRRILLVNRRIKEEEIFPGLSLPASALSRLDPSDRKDQESYPELLRFKDWVEKFRSFQFWDPKILRSPDRGRHTMLGPSGEHLAPILNALRRKNPNGFNRLLRRIKKLFPTVSSISIEGGGGWGWQSIRIHEQNGRDVTFNSQQVSDGVLRLLAVISLLYVERLPSVITFEEPENGVHPQLIREVVQILRELTQRKPSNDCQVFFTTHSPYVLDEFYDHPEQVFLVERGRPQEGTNITRLSEKKDLSIVRNTFEHSLGEAWVSGLLGATARVKG